MPAATSASRGWAATCAFVKQLSQCSTAALEPCSSELGTALQTRSPARSIVVGGERVPHRPLAIAGARVPLDGAPVQQRLLLRGDAPQLAAQHVAEQPMVPVVLRAAVERDEREVRARPAARASRPSRSARAPRRTAGRRACRGPTCAATNSRSVGESSREHLVAQVLGDEAVAAAEARQHVAGRRAAQRTSARRARARPASPRCGAAACRARRGRARTPAAFSSAVASPRVIASSACRSSVTRPWARSRATGTGSSLREASATLTSAGSREAIAATSHAPRPSGARARRRAPAPPVRRARLARRVVERARRRRAAACARSSWR